MMSDRRLGNRGFIFSSFSPSEEQSFLLEAINGERGLCTLDEMYENSREEFFLDHAFVCLTGNNAIESMRDNSKEGGAFRHNGLWFNWSTIPDVWNTDPFPTEKKKERKKKCSLDRKRIVIEDQLLHRSFQPVTCLKIPKM